MMRPMPPTIPSQRVVLGPLSQDDAPAFFAYRGDPEVRRYQSFEPSSLTDATAFIAKLATTPFGTPDTWFQLAIRLSSGELIGDLGVHFEEDPRQVEIGFTLAPEHQGRGFASEAVTALLDRLFTEHDTHRVHASVDPRNTASCKLLERLGFRREAHHRQSLWFKGAWVDDVVYATLRGDRPGQAAFAISPGGAPY